ncbi:hypothetical protein Tco_1358601, partial [Tanacetum coccineum]
RSWRRNGDDDDDIDGGDGVRWCGCGDGGCDVMMIMI